MEGLEGFEPPYNRFVVCRVIQLRYRPSFKMVRVEGFEPPIPCSQSRCVSRLRYTRVTSKMVGEMGFEPMTFGTRDRSAT